MGSAPNDSKNPELQYELDKLNGEQIKFNNNRWRARAGRLRDSGGFRVPKSRDTWERVDAPKFDGKVHQLSGFKGANVEDTEGNSFPVKNVLPVPAASQDVDLGDAGPGQGRRAKQRSFGRFRNQSGGPASEYRPHAGKGSTKIEIHARF